MSRTVSTTTPGSGNHIRRARRARVMQSWKPLSARAWMIAALMAIVAASAAHAGDGKKEYEAAVEQGKIYQNDKLLDYIVKLGDRLLAQTPHAGREYKYVLLDDPNVNAHVTADRYIFVNRGLLNVVTSEAELASVIGHEIGHVIGRHPARLKARMRTLNALSWLGSMATQTNAIGSATQSVGAVPLMKAKRGMELEADELGAQYLARAGYDPMAIIGMLSAMKDWTTFMQSTNPNARGYHGLFGSHPGTDKRLHDAVGPAMSMVPDEVVEPVGDFFDVIDGVHFGTESATGVVQDQSFYHGGLKFVVTFPQDWDIRNNPQDVTGTAPAGAQDSYVTLSGLQPSRKKQTPEEYITDTLKRDDVTTGEAVEVNGLPGYVGEIEVASGDAKARMIAVVYKDRAVYLFKGEAGPQGDPERFKTDFRQIVESFRNMEESDLAVAQSKKIRVIVAEPGDTFAKLARESSIKNRGEDLLRVINGKWPHGEPRAGDYVKIIK